MKIALSAWHEIVDHDDMALFHGLGYDVVNLGAYLVPRHPEATKRPPLDIDPPPNVVVDACRDTHAAKAQYPDELFEWLGTDGVLIVHHFPEAGIFAQWSRLLAFIKAGGRVIWRSCGQTSANLERTASYYQAQGLERVGYSPKEANLSPYSVLDAVIRFAINPDDYSGWTGEREEVVNITQHLAQRGSATNYGYWQAATEGLPATPLGPGSDEIGGTGELTWDEMRERLRQARSYLYTGTQPAPYTLGFLEAAMTGVPIVSIGREAFGWPDIFEACDLVPLGGYDNPKDARALLTWLLTHPSDAKAISDEQRAFMVENFGTDVVGAQWKAYLS